MLGALAARDYGRAANYFDLPVQRNSRVQNGASELALRLQVLLDSGGELKPFGALSNESTGQVDDGLPQDREDVGTITIGGKQIPVVLTHRKIRDYSVWRVSHETIRHLMSAKVATEVAQAPETRTVTIAGAPPRDWALLLGLAASIFGGLWVVSALVLFGVRRSIGNPETSAVYRFSHAALPPISLLAAVAIFYPAAGALAVAIVARQTLLRYGSVVAVIAVVWFALRLVDALADVAIARMRRRQRRQAASVVTLLRRASKILLLAFSLVGVLDTFGIDVTTGIAALGLGGIALALGAQKTVENLVGSVTLIADRPVQVGDFCRVGDVVGTVEDVGIRSTRIRTNDRTLVTIPNGDLSARQIENFATRDRFLFNPTIGVEYSLSSAKLREAVEIVESVLVDHEKVAEGPRARLANFGESSLDIDVFAYIEVSDFADSLLIRQQLLFAIYERFETAGIGIAFPTRTIVMAEDGPALKIGRERKDAAEDGGGSPADG